MPAVKQHQMKAKMNTFRIPLILALTAALVACGGGGGGRTVISTTSPGPSNTAPQIPTLPAGPSPAVTTGNCALLTAAGITAPAISGADMQATSDILQAVDPVHSYPEFARLPATFMWWLRSGNDRVDLLSLGAAVHETNHKIDSTLRNVCNADGLARFFADGRTYITDLRKSDKLANYSIVAETYPANLRSSRALRFDAYITGSASSSGNDFSILLDELNAYTGAGSFEAKLLASAAYAQLAVRADSDVGGMTDFMLFMQAYLKSARLNYPATYSTIQGQGQTKVFIQFAWSRAEAVLAAAYPYSSAASDGNAIRVPVDVLRAIYSADFLQELDALGITHKTAADFSQTYLR